MCDDRRILRHISQQKVNCCSIICDSNKLHFNGECTLATLAVNRPIANFYYRPKIINVYMSNVLSCFLLFLSIILRCVKMTHATIMRYSLEDCPMTLVSSW